MPRDFDPNQGAVAGFTSGKGKGSIAGGPEGTHAVYPVTADHARSASVPTPGTGVIRGNPNGILGQVRSVTSNGMRDAVKRRMSK